MFRSRTQKYRFGSHSAPDIKALTLKEPGLLRSATPAFVKYNEEQLTAVKLPGGNHSVRFATKSSGLMTKITLKI